MRSSRGALVAVLFSLIGIGVCGYLTFVHLALLRGELVGGAVCGASGSIFNCHAVTASSLGTPLGIPLALWGLIGYLATLSLAFIAWQFSDWSVRALTALTAISLGFVIIDIGLFAAMVMQIRYLCPLCLLTYAVNLGLLFVATYALAQPLPSVIRQIPSALGAFLPAPRVAVVWVLWGVVVTGAVGAVAVQAAARYVSQGPPGMLRKQMEQFVKQQRRVTVNTSGDPTLGAAHPTITVVEFSDFLCPSCHRASQFNPIIIAGHRNDLAFTFKHFPLDMTCNPTVQRVVHANACQIAAATECAHEQGKFWALHDRIFEKGPQYKVADLESDAASSGLDMEAFRACQQAGRGLDAVKRDIAEAQRAGVTSTPTYLINGLVMTGLMTPTVFEEFLRVLRESRP